VPYTPKQKRIARAIVAGARAQARESGWTKRETRMAINTALAVGLQESGLRNLGYGDRDSQGWRQERASIYSDPRNVKASVRRFFDEYEADADKDARLTVRAQQVQQSGFPDAYQQWRGQADDLRKELTRALGGKGGTPPRPDGPTQTTRTPGVDNSPLRAQIRRTALAGRGLPSLDQLIQLKAQLDEARDIPGQRTTTRPPGQPPRKPNRPRGKGGEILEVFHDPLGRYFDEGQTVQGAIGGHQHVHVAASQKRIQRLAKLAQRYGLTVRELEPYDTVDPVHTPGSFHYSDRAFDASGDPKQERRFARRVIRAGQRHPVRR